MHDPLCTVLTRKIDGQERLSRTNHGSFTGAAHFSSGGIPKQCRHPNPSFPDLSRSSIDT